MAHKIHSPVLRRLAELDAKNKNGGKHYVHLSTPTKNIKKHETSKWEGLGSGQITPQMMKNRAALLKKK